MRRARLSDKFCGQLALLGLLHRSAAAAAAAEGSTRRRCCGPLRAVGRGKAQPRTRRARTRRALRAQARARSGRGVCARRGGDPRYAAGKDACAHGGQPPTPPRTNWTRLVPPPLLIGRVDDATVRGTHTRRLRVQERPRRSERRADRARMYLGWGVTGNELASARTVMPCCAPRGFVRQRSEFGRNLVDTHMKPGGSPRGAAMH